MRKLQRVGKKINSIFCSDEVWLRISLKHSYRERSSLGDDEYEWTLGNIECGVLCILRQKRLIDHCSDNL